MNYKHSMLIFICSQRRGEVMDLGWHLTITLKIAVVILVTTILTIVMIVLKRYITPTTHTSSVSELPFTTLFWFFYVHFSLYFPVLISSEFICCFFPMYRWQIFTNCIHHSSFKYFHKTVTKCQNSEACVHCTSLPNNDFASE